MSSHSNHISRRHFVGLAATASLLAPFAVRQLYGAASDTTPGATADGTVPIIFRDPTEVLICGSTLFACDLALQSARAGKKTILVMDRVNPFFEGIACLRSWVDAGAVPEILRGVAGSKVTSEEIGGRTYFNASKAALDIEDQLSQAGVGFFYNAAVTGALGHDGQLAGVVFGGKTGLFAIESAVIVDATAEATVARAAGARFAPLSGPRHYHYVADLAKPADRRALSYAATCGARVEVEIHHYFASFDVAFDSRAAGPFALAEDFARVYAASLECPWAGNEKRFRGANGFLCSGVDRLETVAGRVARFDNLLVFGPQGMTGNTQGSLVLKDPLALFHAFPQALAQTLGALRPVVAPRPEYEFLNQGIAPESAPGTGVAHSFLDPGFAEPGTTLGRMRFQPPSAAMQADVLVVGGGTSGNAATFAAAGLGLKTVCLERGLELGGANTLGGVTNLWYGNKTGAFNDYYTAMGATNDGLNAPGFYRGVTRAGARVLFDAPVTGVATQGRTLRRVYVITPFGLTAVESPHCIDATGDGAVAAWAGCGYTFGGEHDEMTLWASFAGFKPGRPEAMRPFLSPCDERSPSDTTRFILSMRRNGHVPLDSKHAPPPFYLAPRESRHIRGGTTVTYLDVLAGRRFRDGVFRAESNPDIKGLATSDAAKAGFIPTDWRALFRVTVPYSAMVPTRLDNVIIAGKAYSITHDALAVARMQRDLCVMGMVAAQAVRLATEKKVLLRDIPIQELQSVLIAKQMLKPEDIAEDDFGFRLSPEDMVKKVVSKSTMDGTLEPSAMLCLLPQAEVLAQLESLDATANPSVQRLLCFLSHPKGVDAYLTEVRRALEEPVLSSELYGGKGTDHMMPDQGYAPVSALMLGSLAQAGERRAVPLLVKLAERMPLEDAPLRWTWGYFYSLACGFERLSGPEGAAPLKRLLAGKVFAQTLSPGGGDLRGASNIVKERYNYLRMALSRALLRCGDPQGAHELVRFLDEQRVFVARAARAELCAATGQDFGFNAAAWNAWLEKNSGQIKANPLTRRFA